MKKRGASILVVDDEREIVRALQRSLTAHGYTVFTASSGEEAVEMVAKLHPDLLLLDLLLPGMSGLEVCRRGGAGLHWPIIFVSVEKTTTAKGRSPRPGGDSHVRNAFDLT